MAPHRYPVLFLRVPNRVTVLAIPACGTFPRTSYDRCNHVYVAGPHYAHLCVEYPL